MKERNRIAATDMVVDDYEWDEEEDDDDAEEEVMHHGGVQFGATAWNCVGVAIDSLIAVITPPPSQSHTKNGRIPTFHGVVTALKKIFGANPLGSNRTVTPSVFQL